MKCLITGVLGQDGRVLSRLLLMDGHEVIGVARRSSANAERLSSSRLGDFRSFRLVQGDVTDAPFLSSLFDAERPDEIYNLAAMSHVGHSFETPSSTWRIVAGGALNCLEGIRLMKRRPRFYQASSSEMFGASCSALRPMKQGGGRIDFERYPSGWPEAGIFQDEKTPFRPNSPYAVAKLAAHEMVRVHRDSYGVHASAGILFNHTSVLRTAEFVEGKVTRFAGALRRHLDGRGPHPGRLRLGNLDAVRDWGWAEDYSRAMVLMVRAGEPADYVVATGEARSIRELLDAAFEGLPPWRDCVDHDPSLLRPSEVPFLRGDSSLARRELGWATSVTFRALIASMVIHHAGAA